MTDLISLLSKRLSESSLAIQFESINSLALGLFYGPTLTYPHVAIGETIALILRTFVGKVMSLLFNMLSRFVITFLPRSKCLFISWLQSPSTVILELREVKFVTASSFPPSICHGVMGLDAMILVFLNVEFQASFFTLPFHPKSRGALLPLHFLPLEWYHQNIWGYWYFSLQSWFHLRFTQSSILHDIRCIEVKETGWQYTALSYSYSNFEPVCCSMSDSVAS